MNPRRGRAPGPVPKGICPVCSELRHLRTGGVLGSHKRMYRSLYRGGPCPGIDLPAVLFGPEPPPISEPEGKPVEAPPIQTRASFLSPPDFHRLDWACQPIRKAFGTPPYLVGSVLTRPDFRDIDLRLILADEVVETLFGADGAWGTEENPTPHGLRLLLDIALSDLIAKAAGLPWPIDFQIQSMTEANVPEHGVRNPMGVR